MPLPTGGATDRKAALRAVPPLIKAYLRLGGVVGDGACIDAGFEDHVLLSADFTVEQELKMNAGAGYSSVLAIFVPKLRYAGVPEATIQKILVDNPRRFLAFVPKV